MTPHDVARTTAGVVLALYAAASLLLLAIAFLVAGCLIQHRIISVFTHHSGTRASKNKTETYIQPQPHPHSTHFPL